MILPLAMAVALGVDALVGWPAPLFARIGHPVTWLGRLIGALDRGWNRGRARRLKGTLAALAVIGLAAGAGWAAQAAVLRLAPPLLAPLALGLLAWPLVAARSMHDHVAAVARPLRAGDLAGARAAVAMIVGRDPSALPPEGVARAALESLAENASDGIVAPLVWGALLGLPGICGYKAINTLDSMIGHRTARHERFGWAAARIDDVANLLPARLTGALFALLSRRPGAALRAMAADARRHRSPNAGWPEAAMAGALGVRLSGPRIYDGRLSAEPWVNAAGADPAPEDLARGLALFGRLCAALGGGLMVAGLLLRSLS